MQTNTDEHYVDSETRIPTQILDAEIEVLDKRRTAVGLRWAPEKEPDAPVEDAGGHKKPVGLALSGGGIRSASFSLGVMQALAAGNT